MSYREGRFWQPDVTVATIVAHQGKLLLVEEYAGGQLVLNQPAGHLEPDESLQQAALRETLEETGWHVRLTGFVGAYQWQAPETQRHYLRFAFCAEPLQHDATRPLDTGIVQALWLTPQQLQDAHLRHRSPLVWQTVSDWQNGACYPLHLSKQLP